MKSINLLLIIGLACASPIQGMFKSCQKLAQHLKLSAQRLHTRLPIRFASPILKSSFFAHSANFGKRILNAAPRQAFRFGIGTTMALAAINAQGNTLQQPTKFKIKKGIKAGNPTIFTHGLGGDKRQGTNYQVDKSILFDPFSRFIEGPLVTFDLNSATNPQLSTLGQDADIETLYNVYKNFDEVELAGVSCGASITAAILGSKKPANVPFAILESLFAHVKDVVRKKLGFLGSVSTASVHQSTKFIFPNYDPNGLQPIDHAASIPHTTITVIIASKEDTLIAPSSSKKIYDAMVQAGHPAVYYLELDRGAHANIINGPDGDMYRNVIHAIRKHHGLSHNKKWAKAGYERFTLCQPKPTPPTETRKSFWQSISK